MKDRSGRLAARTATAVERSACSRLVNRSRSASSMMAAVLLAWTAACGDTALPSESVAVTYSVSQATLEVGKTLQLSSPWSGRTTWRSSNTAVATVTDAGLATGMTAGTATITAKSGKYRSDTNITVVGGTAQPASAGMLHVTPAEATVITGGTAQLTAALVDGSGNPVPGATYSWSSASAAVATVSSSGLVTGVSAGVVTIRATSGSYSGSSTVTVTNSSDTAPTGFFVAPNGSASGDGSLSRPWDLATALNQPTAVRPGAVIWLRGGTYRGTFASYLRGTSSAPIVVRQYPGERAIIDAGALTESAAALNVRGEWVHFRDFELMSSALHRTSSRPHGVLVYASNTKFINLVIHDLGVAMYTADDRTNVEIYGCIIYNNGWETTRGNGHAVYIKNSTGSKLVRDNISFNQFGYGLHGYTNLGSGGLSGITFDGNVSFNSGSLSANPSANTANILLGGQEPVIGGRVTNNMTYFSPGVTAYNVVLGWSSSSSRDVTATSNYIVGGDHPLQVWAFEQTGISGNTVATPNRPVQLADATLPGHAWSGNTYYRDPSAQGWRHQSSSYTFSNWKSNTGLDGTSQALSGMPTGTRVFVRPNLYEAGRATVIVYNWGRQSAVSVNLSGVLSAGDQYEIRSAQNFFGAPLARGTFGGSTVSIPMGSVTAAQPIGGSPSAPPQTGPDFDVVVVRRVTGS
jgi:hypothetical protein